MKNILKKMVLTSVVGLMAVSAQAQGLQFGGKGNAVSEKISPEIVDRYSAVDDVLGGSFSTLYQNGDENLYSRFNYLMVQDFPYFELGNISSKKIIYVFFEQDSDLQQVMNIVSSNPSLKFRFTPVNNNKTSQTEKQFKEFVKSGNANLLGNFNGAKVVGNFAGYADVLNAIDLHAHSGVIAPTVINIAPTGMTPNYMMVNIIAKQMLLPVVAETEIIVPQFTQGKFVNINAVNSATNVPVTAVVFTKQVIPSITPSSDVFAPPAKYNFGMVKSFPYLAMTGGRIEKEEISEIRKTKDGQFTGLRMKNTGDLLWFPSASLQLTK